MPSEPFADLRELAAAATKRPWAWAYNGDDKWNPKRLDGADNADVLTPCDDGTNYRNDYRIEASPDDQAFITSLANQCDALLSALDESRARAEAADGRAQMVEAAARVNKSERDDAIARAAAAEARADAAEKDALMQMGAAIGERQRADAAEAENAELRDRLGIALDEPHPFVTRCGPSALDVAKAENERLREALRGFVDGECHCDEKHIASDMCVQCKARAALNPGATP